MVKSVAYVLLEIGWVFKLFTN